MTLLRRFALAALIIFFVASTTSSLWSQAQPPETRTGYWRGQHITYQWVTGKDGIGRAIYQGDILLENVTDSPNQGPHTNGQGIVFNQYFWPKVGGVAQVPYTIDPASGDVDNINSAITAFNATFAGVIQFVKHNSEANYVDFNLDPGTNNGECEATEGDAGGGEQFAMGAGGTFTPCTIATIEHEMGHIVGLWHEQARDDRNTYINVNYNAVIKASRGNFDPPPDTEGIQDLTLFDYASIMEYPAYSFSRNGLPCIETIPAGIPLSNNSGYSASDIDAIMRLYGATPTQVTVTSNPPGLKVSVDGQTITTPQVFPWTLNSTHTLAVASGAQTIGNPAISYSYGRWNDSTAQSHSITITPGNNFLAQPATSPAVTVYSANFIQLVPYTNVISPAGTGTVTPSPAPLTYSGITGQYYIIRQPVTLTAAPNAGQNFLSYINSPFYLSGGIGANPKTFNAMDDGSAINLTTNFTSSPVSTVTTSPVEANLGVHVDNTFWYAPVNFAWTPGSSHSVEIDSTIYPESSNTYFTFTQWSDGGAQSHNVTAQSANTTYTADILGNYHVDVYALEGDCAATIGITPASPDPNGYYPAGSPITITETPAAGLSLTGWLYDLSGTGSSQNLTVNDEVLADADYNVNTTPVSITSLSPASAAAGGPAFTLTINGTGFTTGTYVYINGFYRTVGTFISSTKITVPIAVTDIATAGGFQLAVGNFNSGGCGPYIATTFFVSIGSGSGTPIAKVSPASLTLKAAAGTTSAPGTVTLSNTGTGALPITSIVASGDFAIQSTTCSTSLAKGANCTVMVTFNPTIVGAITGALTFTDGATPSPQVVKLTGTSVAALAFSPTSLTLPSVAAGSTSSANLTVTNKSTNTAVSLSPSVGSYYSITGGTCGSSLAASGSCTYTVSFSPLYKGSIKGALDIATNVAFSPSVVGLTGTASSGATVPLTISPASLTFTSTGIGATAAAKVITLTNKSAGTVTLGAISADADYAAFGSGTTPCASGLALAKSAKCTFSVTFTPAGTGSIKGAVSISSTGGAVSPQIVGLTGTGALPVVVSPTSLTFSQPVGGTSQPQTVALTNNSGATLNISSIATSGEFAATPGTGASPCSATVAAGATCSFSVTFTPNVKAAVTGAVTIIESAPAGPVVMKLTGTGTSN